MIPIQFGSLTSGEKTTFQERQSATNRKPSWVVWISGLDSDPSDYVLEIDTERAIEGARGRGHLNIGRALIEASNDSNLFFSNGKPTIGKNARMKVWAGFGGLNIPIFTGVVDSVYPVLSNNTVLVSCLDYMGLLRQMDVEGHQGSNNTVKLLAEAFATDVGASSNISSTDETTATITRPTFEPQKALGAFEELCDSVFCVAFFDVNGSLVLREREYPTTSDFVFDDDNVMQSGVTVLASGELINDVDVEYRDSFLSTFQDQESIDSYRRRHRRLRIPFLNYIEVSAQTTGSTDEELDYNLEGFKFTSSADAAKIDTVGVKMKMDGASGNLTLKIYSDSAGSPDTLLATSQIKASAELFNAWAWEYFYFTPALDIAPSTAYWGVIDTTSVTGTVYVRISAAAATSMHAHYNGSWTLEADKKILHQVRSSIEGQRVAQDIVRYFKERRGRLKIVAPAVPQLQLMDEVFVDVSQPTDVLGRMMITGRRHIITPESYVTTDTMEEV